MSRKTLLTLLVGLSTMAACANTPVARLEKTDAQPAQPPSARSAQELSAQLLYQYLLAEIAAQRGELALASDALLDLAIKTRNPRIAQRATEMAIFARQSALALKAAQLWLEHEPDSAKARQTYVSLLIGAGRFKEARPQLDWLLKQSGRSIGEAFMQLPGLLLRHPDKAAAVALMAELAASYPAVPEASYALAQVAWHAGQTQRAIQAAEEALRLKPGWESAALFKGHMLQRHAEEQVVPFWQDFLAQYPDAREVRLALARQYTRMGRLAQARAEFETLLSQGQAKAEILVSLGLLAMQMHDLDAAEGYFMQAMAREETDHDQVRIYLGQLAETRGRHEQALSWYHSVHSGRLRFDAGLKAAVVLGKLGRIEEGRALLAGLAADTDAERVQLIQAEAQMLREAKDYEQVYAVLSRALEAMPEAVELLYDRAMAAERLDRLDVLERDLRLLIRLKPDHAHAYNALGYTLADRTDRIAEAIELLNQALKLAPDDPFILDSMGWALFKAGRHDEALAYLQRAFALQPDPEIAAHLGEVLWVRGERELARRIWQRSLQEHPENEVLRKTVGRLQP